MKTHGFARLYSKVLCEYFGGLRRHFISVKPLLTPGAMCAYVIGDQSSYLQIPIPTAKIMRDIAVEAGFEHIETRRWRRRWSTSSNESVAENVLILRVPAKGGVDGGQGIDRELETCDASCQGDRAHLARDVSDTCWRLRNSYPMRSMRAQRMPSCIRVFRDLTCSAAKITAREYQKGNFTN